LVEYFGERIIAFSSGVIDEKMIKLKNPIVAFALLALAANTALRFHSWLVATTEEQGVSIAENRSLLLRRENFYERSLRILKSKGIDPTSLRFQRMLNHRQHRHDLMMTSGQVMRKLRPLREVWLRDGKNAKNGGERVEAAAALAEEIEMNMRRVNDYKPLEICNRPTEVGTVEGLEFLQQHAQCDEITNKQPIYVLKKVNAYGRTGNHITEFQHAIQESRDKGFQLGIHVNSWAMRLLREMWVTTTSDDWQEKFEQAFCVKVFLYDWELNDWEVIPEDTKELLLYKSHIPLANYMASQQHILRSLFRYYDSGDDTRFRGLQGTCSGIDAIFEGDRKDAVYSVIHSRSLEGEPGLRLLGTTADRSGCDPVAALEMRPDYVKSILKPLGMLDYPIVFITDGQDPSVLERLKADPDIGPQIRAVPEEASWIGGDLTLAIMSNVFIGNPASSFASFIAKSRLALGFGHSYMFRAKDENGKWKTVCGDHCVFDRTIQEVRA